MNVGVQAGNSQETSRAEAWPGSQGPARGGGGKMGLDWVGLI